MFETVDPVASDLVLMRRAWSLEREASFDCCSLCLDVIVGTYLSWMTLSLIVMPETVTSELIEPYIQQICEPLPRNMP